MPRPAGRGTEVAAGRIKCGLARSLRAQQEGGPVMAHPEHIHDEQVRIWAEELLDAVTISGTEWTPGDYESVVDAHQAAEYAVRYLIACLYGPTKEES